MKNLWRLDIFLWSFINVFCELKDRYYRILPKICCTVCAWFIFLMPVLTEDSLIHSLNLLQFKKENWVKLILSQCVSVSVNKISVNLILKLLIEKVMYKILKRIKEWPRWSTWSRTMYIRQCKFHWWNEEQLIMNTFKYLLTNLLTNLKIKMIVNSPGNLASKCRTTNWIIKCCRIFVWAGSMGEMKPFDFW